MKEEGYEIDFMRRPVRLIAEVDGCPFHLSSGPFEPDRDRDSGLLASGFRIVRMTCPQLTREPEAVLARLLRTPEPKAG